MSAGAKLPPLALTMGDPAGIAGEITLKAYLALRTRGECAFALLADSAHLAREASALSLKIEIARIDDVSEAHGAFASSLPVLHQPIGHEIAPGKPNAHGARASLRSLERAASLTREGRTAAIVTNPVHKQGLYEIGFAHPGQTEFLGALCGTKEKPVMMLAVPGLRVVPVTIHLALADVAKSLHADEIVRIATVTARALSQDFGIARPRLAVTGLNPHAGEGGAMGREEIEIIAPAIARLRAQGIAAEGPKPADTLFHEAARKTYDAAICMYHDQALIPLKTVDFAQGVNVTLGLPIARTSPDHGTAFDIAGRGKADPASLIAAIEMARAIAERRAA